MGEGGAIPVAAAATSLAPLVSVCRWLDACSRYCSPRTSPHISTTTPQNIRYCFFDTPQHL
jgi:hypothetical protein